MRETKLISTASLKDTLRPDAWDTEGIYFVDDFGLVMDTKKVPLNNWTKADQSYRSSDWQIIYIKEGKVPLKLNLIKIDVAEGQLLVIPPGVLVSIIGCDERANSGTISIMPQALPPTFDATTYIHASLKPTQQKVVWQYFELLESLVTMAGQQTLIKLSESLLQLAFTIQNTANKTEKGLSKEQCLLNHFQKLLHQHGTQQHKVSFYAEQMAISPNYLNSLIKQASGQTILEWINQLLISESKAALTFSHHTVSQISSALNFQGSAHFCRFFKKHSAMTPSEYRRESRR